jgi:hypothetical protein
MADSIFDGLRAPRTQETREKDARPPVTFTPSGLIPQLENEDPDYVYRWIRVESRDGKLDNKNLTSKFKEGWVPVKLDEFPELFGPIQDLDRDMRFDGMVRHAELLLCKNSKEKIEARRKYFRDLAARQMESVNSDYFKESDRRMPLFKEGSSIVGSTKPY